MMNTRAASSPATGRVNSNSPPSGAIASTAAPTGLTARCSTTRATGIGTQPCCWTPRYQSHLSDIAVISGRLFYGQVKWRGQYVSDYSGPPYDVDMESAEGRWAGAEAQLHYSGWNGQRLLLGVDYQNNLRQNQFAEDAPPSLRCTATGSATDPCLEDRRGSYRLGVYVQDDFALAENLSLNLGLRHDQSDVADSQWSPRLGLIWRPDSANVLKLLFGSAFRVPNAYERYYSYPGVGAAAANPSLKVETIKTYELVWERHLGADLRLSAGANVNQVENWIVQVDTALGSQFQNQPSITSRGLDLELKRASLAAPGCAPATPSSSCRSGRTASSTAPHGTCSKPTLPPPAHGPLASGAGGSICQRPGHPQRPHFGFTPSPTPICAGSRKAAQTPNWPWASTTCSIRIIPTAMPTTACTPGYQERAWPRTDVPGS